MMSINTVNLIGYVGIQPELKTTQSGKSVCSFNLAVKGRADKTNWIKLVFWNNLAEIVVKYIRKGEQLGVTGEINVREYEVEGSKRTAFEINVNDITFIGSKKEESQEYYTDSNEDLPF